jgi:hypothetical protein
VPLRPSRGAVCRSEPSVRRQRPGAEAGTLIDATLVEAVVENAGVRGPRQSGCRLHLSREMEQAGSRPCKRVSCAGDRTGDRNANFRAGTPTQYVVRSTG